MAIKFDTFKTAGGGAGTDTLDDVTTRGATTTNSITVGGVTIGTEYSLPSTDGTTSGQVLTTDAAGNLSFTTLDFTGGVEYKGTFNATAGTPSLINAEKGDLYIIDTAGTIYGKDWEIGDHLLINEDMDGSITNSKIDKIDNSEAYTTLASLTDTNISGPASAQVLRYNGTAWANQQLAYSDLSGTPTNVSTFTNDANYVASGDNVSTLTNDANYVASGDNVSTLTNDANYIANGDNVSTLTNDAGYLTNINSEDLNDLNDVTITTPTNGQVLSYLSGTWVNAAASGGATALNDLTDVTITAAANGEYLRYNGSAWVDASLALADDATPSLSGDLDVNGNAITSSSSGDILINPDGTGAISIGADVIPDADATHTIGSEDFRYITTYSDLNGAVRFKAKNDEGSAITAGQVLYIKGLAADGETPTVGLADADDASKMPAFGLAFAGANDQAEVQVVSFGNLLNVATSSYSVGDTLFVSTTAGGLTNSAPTGESSLIQNIGKVVRSHATSGVIKVGGAGRTNATPNLNNGYFFLGNASNQAVSTQLSSINVSTFTNDANYIANGDNVSSLTNDAGYLTNINSESISDLSDVTITAAASSEYLRYNGSAWVDAALSVVDDTSPQLGGDLDTNGNELITASNANLILRPNGTGHVFLGGNTNPAELRLYCESADAHYVGFKSPTHAEMGTNPSVTWRLPITDAAASGDALVSDGSGNLSFTTISGGSTPAVTSVSQGTDYTITYDSSVVEDVYIVTPTADININLPAAATCGSGYKYQIKNLGAFTLTIDPNGTEYIDYSGQTTFDIVQYESVTLITDGSNWFII